MANKYRHYVQLAQIMAMDTERACRAIEAVCKQWHINPVKVNDSIDLLATLQNLARFALILNGRKVQPTIKERRLAKPDCEIFMDDRVREMYDHYQQGRTMAEVGRAFGVTGSAVSALFRRYDLPVRRPGERAQSAGDTEQESH